MSGGSLPPLPWSQESPPSLQQHPHDSHSLNDTQGSHVRAPGGGLASTSEPGTSGQHQGNVDGEVGRRVASWTWFLCCRLLRACLSEGAAGRQACEEMSLDSVSGCLLLLEAGATRVQPEKWPSCRHLR